MDTPIGVEGLLVGTGSPATRVIVLRESEDDGFSLIGWRSGTSREMSGIRFLCRFRSAEDLTDFMRLSNWEVCWS